MDKLRKILHPSNIVKNLLDFATGYGTAGSKAYKDAHQQVSPDRQAIQYCAKPRVTHLSTHKC